MITPLGYAVGIIGVWDFCDGLGSYYAYKDMEGRWEQSFRVMRMLRGVVLIVIGAMI